MVDAGERGELSPSAERVVELLEQEGPLSFEKVVVGTRMPRDTVREAVDSLRDQQVVERREGDDDAVIALV